MWFFKISSDSDHKMSAKILQDLKIKKSRSIRYMFLVRSSQIIEDSFKKKHITVHNVDPVCSYLMVYGLCCSLTYLRIVDSIGLSLKNSS